MRFGGYSQYSNRRPRVGKSGPSVGRRGNGGSAGPTRGDERSFERDSTFTCRVEDFYASGFLEDFLFSRGARFDTQHVRPRFALECQRLRPEARQSWSQDRLEGRSHRKLIRSNFVGFQWGLRSQACRLSILEKANRSRGRGAKPRVPRLAAGQPGCRRDVNPDATAKFSPADTPLRPASVSRTWRTRHEHEPSSARMPGRPATAVQAVRRESWRNSLF